MRNLQIGIFVTGSIAFLVSVVFMGGWLGDTLWRTGVAAMLAVLAMRALWPAGRVETTERREYCMIVVPLIVEDAVLRKTFLSTTMHQALAELAADAQPAWGRMSAQQMVEHLLWSVRGSTGSHEFTVATPEHLLERAKRFLYHDRQTPHDFMNPLLTEGLPPLEHPDLATAVAALRAEMLRFLEMAEKEPEAVRPHPIFGPLKPEEWERSHFKHMHHHLQQFGVVG